MNYATTAIHVIDDLQSIVCEVKVQQDHLVLLNNRGWVQYWPQETGPGKYVIDHRRFADYLKEAAAC